MKIYLPVRGNKELSEFKVPTSLLGIVSLELKILKEENNSGIGKDKADEFINALVHRLHQGYEGSFHGADFTGVIVELFKELLVKEDRWVYIKHLNGYYPPDSYEAIQYDNNPGFQ